MKGQSGSLTSFLQVVRRALRSGMYASESSEADVCRSPVRPPLELIQSMSVLFALVAALGWGSSGFAAGRARRQSSATSVVLLTYLASVIALFVVAVRFGQFGFSVDGSPTATDIAWGLAAGIAGGAGAMLLLQGLGKGSMAVVAPIAATGAALIPVLFGIVTGDPITVFGILGIAMALVAIVLVSLTGGDDSTLEATDEELLVPDHWTDEFQLPVPHGEPFAPPTQPGMLAAPAAAPPGPGPGQMLTGNPVSEPLAPLAPPAIEMTHSSAPTPPPPLFGLHNGELRMSLRTVRQAVLALVATAVLSAAAIASQPIGQLLDGAEYTGAVTAQLVFSLVIIGLAAFALNNVKPLFDFSDLTRRRVPVEESVAAATAPGAAVQDGAALAQSASSALSWRAIVGQPGVTEALFSGVGFGLFFVFISRASEIAGYWPLVSARGVSVVMFTLIALASSGAMLPERGSRMPVVLAGLLDAAAVIFFVMSTRVGLLSVGVVLAALYPVVTVLLARIITKEKIRPQQMLGVGLALCAVGLLAV
jgi:drug/metabolite transporter (DMT)-like permease